MSQWTKIPDIELAMINIVVNISCHSAGTVIIPCSVAEKNKDWMR